MKSSTKLLLIGLVVALFGLACGLTDSATEKLEEQAENVAAEVEQKVEEVGAEVQATAEAAAEQAQETAQEAAQEAGDAATEAGQQVEEAVTEAQAGAGETEEAAVEFNSINAKLAEFNSYRTSIIMEFSGTDSAGAPTDGKIDMFLEFTKEPSAMHMNMNMEGSTVEETGGVGSFEIYSVDNTLYMQNPEDGSWLSFPNPEGSTDDPFSQGFFSPDDLIDIPPTARRDLLPQDVNGISTWHYTFDERDIEDSDLALESASGEMWVARDGGYPVKIIFEATGSSLDPSSDTNLFAEGSMKISYELSDINGNFTITVPEEALNAEGFDFGFGSTDPADIEYPLPADAEVDFAMAGLVSFYTNGSVNDTAEFFKQALPAEGWAIDDSFEFISEDSALLSFTKDGVDLTVSINLESDGRTAASIISSE